MLLLGIDIGTSSVKVSVIDASTRDCVGSASYPETEVPILTPQVGWAEQSPDTWWEHTKLAILKLHAGGNYDPMDIRAIGIAYQMHGLVMVDKDQKVLRNSIIWCDSRAVELGNRAFNTIGQKKCLKHLLNSPGNFTASKLAWVKENEPDIYARTRRIMLPGDFIAMKFTDQVSTSISSLSEGVFWDFRDNELSKDVFGHFELETNMIPQVQDVFSEHGRLNSEVAHELSLTKGIPVSYKAGDQPNNALSLNVLAPGEVAATAGTSGVIYGVTDQLVSDPGSRINTFAHVNYTEAQRRLGVLLCINGTGILNSWIKNMAGNDINYEDLNRAAASVSAGSNGLMIFPFGNGAERMLNNRVVNAQIQNVDFNIHRREHLFRAAQEGIAFAFRYGLDIMRANGMKPRIIRAAKTNMFLSNVFTRSFVNVLDTPVELYGGDGSVGAAIGAGLGTNIYDSPQQAFNGFKPIETIYPDAAREYDHHYTAWAAQLEKILN